MKCIKNSFILKLLVLVIESKSFLILLSTLQYLSSKSIDSCALRTYLCNLSFLPFFLPSSTSTSTRIGNGKK